MRALVILNDAPYGSERSYNGLRLASTLAKRDGNTVKVFLLADAAGAGKGGQKVPQGFYNIGRMLQALVQQGAEIGVCGSCMDARGLSDGDLIDGACRGTMEQLADWTIWAERVVVF